MTRLIILYFACSLLIHAKGNHYADMPSEDFFHQTFFLETINLSSVDFELIEAGVFHLTNKYRKEKGQKNLEYQSALSDAAYLHSKEMTEKHFFDHHNRYNKSLANISDRVNYVHYTRYETLAENIFYGYVNLRNPGSYFDLCNFIVQNFIKSKGHRENLLAKDVNEIGCGIYFEKKLKDGYIYFNFTQDFAWR